jgi:peptidyl-prolyl cis-trans isomerase B (cyclophilin B)
MAQHKAPTAVTFAATTEKQGLALLVDRYWKLALGLAVAVTAVILYFEFRAEAARAARDEQWQALLAKTSPDGMGGLTGAPSELGTVADQLQGSEAGAWALYVAAKSAAEKKDFDAALASLSRFRTLFPSHPLLQEGLATDSSGKPVSPVAALEQRVQAQKEWAAAHATLFANPAPPADAPRVRFHTDKGTITVQLYPNLAPKHVENFLKLVREGFYAGTKFHGIRKGSFVLGGDPNSKDADVSHWGEGGPGYGVDSEETGLKLFAGALAAWKKPGDTQSSGSQFLITVADAHALDSQYVVFGKVTDGMDAVAKVEASPLVPSTERPEDPTTIQSAEVL